MGGAQAGEVASRLAAAALEDTDPGRLDRPGARRVADPGGEPPGARALERRPGDVGHGDDDDGRARRGRRRRHRPRRRLARLPRPRRQASEQLTDDHSLVNELLRSGKLSPEEADTHPQRSVITRALGTDPTSTSTRSSSTRADGDVFLICSDGLTVDGRRRGRSSSVVERNRDDLDQAAKLLVAAANRGGGEDNITVVMFGIGARRRCRPLGRHARRWTRSSSPDPQARRGRTSRRQRRRARGRRRPDGPSPARVAPRPRWRCSSVAVARVAARLGADALTLSYRNRELAYLVVVGVITAVGFASVYISRKSQVSAASLTYAVFFFALYLVAHVVARFTVPNADPYLLPLAGLLTAVGLTEIYRLGPLERAQAGPLGRDRRRASSRPRSSGCGATTGCSRTTSTSSVSARSRSCFMPLLPGIGQTVNGARLWIHFGRLQFQPGELGEDRADRLPRRVPAREARGARAGADQGLGAAARHLGRRDARALRDRRPRQRAPLLRDLPRDPVRRHRAALVRRRVHRALLRRRRRPSTRARRTCASASSTGCSRGRRTRSSAR